MNTVWREGCTRVGRLLVFDRTGEFTSSFRTAPVDDGSFSSSLPVDTGVSTMSVQMSSLYRVAFVVLIEVTSLP